MNTKLKLVVAFAGLFGFSASAFQASAETVGVAWLGQSSMTNRVMDGLTERLADIAPDIELEIHSNIGSEEELGAVLDQFQATMPAMVVMRSNGVRFVVKNPTRIPTLFGGATHPGLLGAIENLDAPEGNITGVTQFIDHRIGLQSFMAVVPSVRSFLLITQNGHPAALTDQNGVAKACADLKLQCEASGVGSIDELKATAAGARGKFDAIILGSQALITENAGAAADAAESTPVFAFSETAVKNGALGGLVADGKKLGGMLADSLVDVVKNGKPIRAVPVKMDPDPVLFLNAKTLQKSGIQISVDILSSATIIE